MTRILAELTPLDPIGGTRLVVRAASAQDRAITGLNNVKWWPAISALPSLGLRLFEGDFSSDTDTGTASLTVQVDKLAKAEPNVRRYLWAGARLTLYAAASGTAWPWPVAFKGIVERFEAAADSLKLTARVDTEPFEKDALTATYAGTGGAEGDANLKNKVKPWVFGRALNVEPVLVDAVDSVFQFSAYGPIQAVTALYERGGAFGPSVGDFADHAALVAAALNAGEWATCLAEGMVRLGAPPHGVITGDVEGDAPAGTLIRRTGAIIERIASHAGIAPELIDSASLAALDAAVPRNVNLVIDEQATVLDLARRLARPCNAQAGISWAGQLFATRVVIGAPALTLDAQGRGRPGVTRSVEHDVRPPFWRVGMGAERCWRVHSFDEIAFFAAIVDRGPYSATETYREGNIVQHQDSSWLYINPEPTSGNAPPLLPTTSNAYWQVMARAGADGQAPDVIFKREASQPATPAASPGVPSGWYGDVDSVPPSGDPLWASFGTRPSAGSNYTWQIPVRQEGVAGTAGLSIAEVTAYKRASTTPAVPTGGSYDFGTATLTAPSGWSAVIPTGTDPLYAARGTASKQGTGGTATPAWLGVGKLAQDGAGAFTIIHANSDTVSPTLTSITKVSGSGWAASAYSKEGYSNGAFVSFRPITTDKAFMIALNKTPAGNNSYTTLDHAIYCRATGVISIFEDGAEIVANAGTYSTSDILSIHYDGKFVRYFRNGTPLRTVGAAADIVFHMDSSFETIGGAAADLVFSPAGPAGDSAVSASLTTPNFTALAYASGTLKPGALDNATGTLELREGDVLLAAADGVTFSVPAGSVGVSGTIDSNGTYAATDMTADSGYLKLRASYGGKNYDLRFGGTKSRQGSAANEASTAVTGLNNGGTYVASHTVDLAIAAGATINVDATAVYNVFETSGPSTTWAPQVKLSVKNVTDGGADTDLAGSTVTGSEARWTQADLSRNPGSFSTSGSTSNGAGATKTFRATLWTRKSSGTSSGPVDISGSLNISAG